MIFRQFLFCIITSVTLTAQFGDRSFRDDTLAMVDRHAVTTRDLFERISMMPYEDKLTDKNFSSIKRKAVESLVGEYLLSQLDIPDDSSDWRIPYTNAAMERMFMRDVLFKREIRENVKISDAEIAQGIRQFTKKRKLLVVQLPDGDQGNSIVAEWKRQRSKGITHRQYFNSAKVRFDTVTIAFGSADSSLESAAYALKNNEEIRGPVVTQMFGRVAVTMIQEEPNPDAQQLSVIERRKSVADALRDRKESQLQVRYFDTILRGQTMTADSALFQSVSTALRELILRDTLARKVPTGYRYTPTDIYTLTVLFKHQLDSAITFGSFGRLTLGIFLELMYYYDFTVPSLRPRSFAVSFFQMLRAVTEGEMVAAEAERRGLRYDPDVRRDMAVWSNHHRSRKGEYRLADSVGYKEWEPYWSLWRKYPAVVEENLRFSIEEILLNDSLTAISEIERIRAGGELRDGAAHTYRNEWINTQGRSGWFPFKKYPDLSAKLMMLPSNEISGPLKLKEGYSIVRLLGRTFDGDSVYIDSLLNREALRIRTQHQKAAVTAYIAQSALRRSIQFYDEKIASADVENINLITRRIIGFGGRMNAAPYLLSQWQWVEHWKKLKELQP
jgi:hypothetical protein